MSEELIYQRQIADVTKDIRRKTGEFLLNAIEIGRLLFEAKSMVEPGGWSRYIEEELPFSHSASEYVFTYIRHFSKKPYNNFNVASFWLKSKIPL